MLHQIRNRKNTSKGIAQAGFTIIEVMIVLAIAGLIMAIVFLAIPALQRTNRNTQRKNDAARVGSLVNDYVANNNGALPGCVQLTAVVCAGLNLSAATGTNEKFSIMGTAANVNSVVCTAVTCTGALPTPAQPAADTLTYYKNADCGGGNVPKFNASTRAYAIYYYIEGATTTQCISS